MSFKYKSFFLGILVTSLTWAVILYMYTSLNLNSTRNRRENNKGDNDYDYLFRTAKKTDEFTQTWRSNFEDNFIPNNLPASLIKNDLKYKYSVKRKADGLHEQNNVTIKYSSKLMDINKDPGQQNIEDLGLVRSSEDQKNRDTGYRQHAFNVLVSNRLSLKREIPDTRNPLCKSLTYAHQLPKASIIICFYNEAKSALLRTVHSIYQRTPLNLIEEVILVDDFSDHDDLKADFEEYFAMHFEIKIKLIRTDRREGLMRARMFGASKAQGQVLVFLDSHCEVNRQWLEPLLHEITLNHTTVVCPIIDIVDADTFKYVASPIVRGGFNWGLHFKWDGLPPNSLKNKSDFVKPYKSPTMAGGLFAIDRQYFMDMGQYDGGMDTWGGENLEISFRMWMCGGSLKIVPCSRVGHIFRKRRPYGSPSGHDTVTYNSLRVAYVWLDEYKEFYFKIRPDARDQLYGNITDRIELRKKLNCKSFDWYLKNIYPELKPPNAGFSKDKYRAMKHRLSKKIAHKPVKKRSKSKILKKYQIRLRNTDLCIESEKDVTNKGSLLVLKNCQKIKSQIWFESDKHELILAELLCLDAGEDYPHLAKCHEMGGSQSWKHKSEKDTLLYNLAVGTCLGVKAPQEGAFIVMEFCTLVDPTMWDLLESQI